MFKDNRTIEEKLTHRQAVVGTDTYHPDFNASNRGESSYAGWAFKDGQEGACLAWVDRRGDMKRIRVVWLDEYRPGKDTHIYVWRGVHETL